MPTFTRFCVKLDIHMILSRIFKMLTFLLCVIPNYGSGLEAPIVHLPNQGIVIGTYMKMFRTQNIKAYLGIQYARASRFSPPDIKINKWNIMYNASVFGPKCWQKPSMETDKQTTNIQQLLYNSILNEQNKYSAFDENCLYLNIFIPDGSPGLTGYAVIVWFHGGDFSSGSSADVDPFQLVFKQKVIVITVAYRLSIMGFLTTGDNEAPGNFGLMDQSAALLWIKKNIAHFGGNSKQISIMGHEAGAISVGLHLTSGDWSKGFFHKAIIMSGNPLSEKAVRFANYYSVHLDNIANIFGCNRQPTSMLITCLKRVDAKILMENIPDVPWGPVVDYGLSNTSKGFIDDLPIELFKNQKYHKVPTLMGITDMEDVLYILGNEKRDDTVTGFEDIENFASKVATNDIQKFNDSDLWCSDFHIIVDSINLLYQNEETSHSYQAMKNFVRFHTDRMYLAPLFLLANYISSDENTYVYFFNIRPKTEFYNLLDWISVPKYFDQIFVWGIPYMNKSKFINRWNSTDKKISEIVMTLWANFARTSNPTSLNIYIKWTTYTTNNPTYLIINEDFNIKSISENHKVSFWNDYYPKLLDFTIECCSYHSAANKFVCTPLILIVMVTYKKMNIDINQMFNIGLGNHLIF